MNIFDNQVFLKIQHVSFAFTTFLKSILLSFVCPKESNKEKGTLSKEFFFRPSRKSATKTMRRSTPGYHGFCSYILLTGTFRITVLFKLAIILARLKSVQQKRLIDKMSMIFLGI